MKFFDLIHQILSEFHEILTVEPLNTLETILKILEFSDVSEGHFGKFWIFSPKLKNTLLGLFFYLLIFFCSNSSSFFYDFIFWFLNFHGYLFVSKLHYWFICSHIHFLILFEALGNCATSILVSSPLYCIIWEEHNMWIFEGLSSPLCKVREAVLSKFYDWLSSADCIDNIPFSAQIFDWGSLLQ